MSAKVITQSIVDSHLRATEATDLPGMPGKSYRVELYAKVVQPPMEGKPAVERESGFCVYEGNDEKMYKQAQMVAKLLLGQVVGDVIVMMAQVINGEDAPEANVILGPDGQPTRAQPGIVRLPPGSQNGVPPRRFRS